jgi:hypothetical protein
VDWIKNQDPAICGQQEPTLLANSNTDLKWKMEKIIQANGTFKKIKHVDTDLTKYVKHLFSENY